VDSITARSGVWQNGEALSALWLEHACGRQLWTPCDCNWLGEWPGLGDLQNKAFNLF